MSLVLHSNKTVTTIGGASW